MSKELAEFAAGLSFEALPASTVSKIEDLFVDILARSGSSTDQAERLAT